jgi:hypothetical protein
MRIDLVVLASLGAGLVSSHVGAAHAQSPAASGSQAQVQYTQAQYAQPQAAPQVQYAQPVQPGPQGQYAQPQAAPQVQYAQPQAAPQVQYAQPQAAPQLQYAQPMPQGQYTQPGYPVAGYSQPAARAPAPDSGVDGAFQLGLSTGVLSYQSTSFELENDGPTVDASSVTWGIRNDVSVELGYGLSRNIVLGGVLNLGGDSNTAKQRNAPDQNESEFSLALGPKLDVMFGSGGKVMPFVGALVLVDHQSGDTGDGNESSQTVFSFGARLGLRAFLVESLSLDPSIFVGGHVGSGSSKSTDNASTFEQDYSVSGFQIGVNIALSGWLR